MVVTVRQPSLGSTSSGVGGVAKSILPPYSACPCGM
jgi:hypothetical protein